MEIVLNRRTLRDIQKTDLLAYRSREAVSSPYSSLNINRDNDTTFIGKTKRVVLHLSPIQSEAISQLSLWSRCRPTLQGSIQFVIYGMNLSHPDSHLSCMDVEFYFDQNGIPPGAFEHALAQWLFNLFSKGKPEIHPRLRLFDIPSLIFKDQDRPSSPSEANQAARDLSELLLNSKKRFGRKAKYLKDVMSKIDFYDSVYVDEEYPVVEPRPVSPS